MTDRYAVIGNPIAHSLSPQIHAEFAQQTAQDMHYERLYAPVGDFLGVVENFVAQQGRGLNVTAPFKRDAYQWATQLDSYAEVAQAVNTLAIDGSHRYGYNTDGIGLVADLNYLQWNLTDQRVLILGAGGATRGILKPLLEKGCQITIANRTFANAQKLQQDFADVQISTFTDLATDWDIVINATSSLPASHATPFDLERFEGAKCYDLSYSATGQTPFLDLVRPIAHTVVDGLGMLIEQAAAAFHIWRKEHPDTHIVRTLFRPPTALKRRFIAGGLCKHCGAEDKVYIEYDDNHEPQRYGCAACNYVEDREGTSTLAIKDTK